MKNPIVSKFLDNGMMEMNGSVIIDSFELAEKIRTELRKKHMSVDYHFDIETGALIFLKVLGRDSNNDFYNESNGNLEDRKQELKKVIVSVLLNEYNNANSGE